MYYGSGTANQIIVSGPPAGAAAYAAADAGRTLRVQSPDCSTFPRKMTSWPPSWKYDVTSEIRYRQSMSRPIR